MPILTTFGWVLNKVDTFPGPMSEIPRTVPPRRRSQNRPTHRQIVARRAVALGVLGVVMIVAGVLVVGSFGEASGDSSVQRYADAWAADDPKSMYAELTPESQGTVSYKQFKRKIDRARATATVRGIKIKSVKKADDETWTVAAQISTRAFGAIDKPLQIPTEGNSDNSKIKWSDQLVFPGLGASASLTRQTALPDRATLQTRDGVALAEGEARGSSLGASAANATGSLGAIPDSAKARYYALGYPADAQIGTTGLERMFELQLAGKPGGTLRAGAQQIASSEPRKARPVKTTIDSKLQQAAAQQQGQRLGAIVILKPRSGEVVGYSGSPFSLLQPPGSTFKIITLAAGLKEKAVDPDSTFEVVPSVQISGVTFENADRELCGGTLTQSFAKSCNSAFGPIGAEVGAKKLIAMAEKFGFDQKPTIQGAATSTMPNEETLNDDLQVASASIGQSTVQATTLQMASVAATIALRGQRPALTLDYKQRGRRARMTRALDPAIAGQVRQMMLAVVDSGTGEFAKIPGVKVAGKTGTAELKSTQDCDPAVQQTRTTETNGQTTITKPCPKPTKTDTDAWFTAFAPAGNPQYVVCVMLVGEGQGRESAAPAARNVLEVALGKKRLDELQPPPAPSVDPNLETETATPEQ